MSSRSHLVVGVVGAGAMGSGIAQVAAAAGHRVILGDANEAATARARDEITKATIRDVEKGRLDKRGADALFERITYAGDLSTGYAVYAECGLIIEAVVEEMSVKRSLFAALEQVVRDDCILATNTSSLSVAAIAGGCARPERVVGIHFFNPAPVMPLVEIVPAITTSDDVAGAAASLIDGWGKTTVVASDTPGFIVNRIARPFYSESLRQMEEGIADFATIDWAMREIAGFRMGPFEMMDLIGNDVNYAVTMIVFESFFYDPRYRPALTQRRLVEAGRYGRKSGRGYYDYRDGAQRPEPNRDEELGHAIVDRTLAMLVNAAVDAVFLRVAAPRDIEMAMMKGVNYPKGLLAWGDEIGPGVILSRLTALQAEYGEERYRASPLLRRRALDGRSLLTTGL
jgi:3-hydroxybutyryl-CoA dehydrogenase